MPDILSSSTLGIYAAMAVLIGFAAFMQGLGGVGFAMFAAPVAAMFVPEMVPGTLLTLGGMVSLLTAVRERRDIRWPAAGTALTGRALGTIIAVSALTQLTPERISILFAVLILAAVALSIKGPKIMATKPNVAIAGVASGIMGTLTSVGAPPLAIAFQHTPGPSLRATIGTILFCGSAFSLLLLAYAGHFTLQQLMLGVALTPFMLAGFTLSNRFRSRISPRVLRTFLLGFCTLSAVGLIIKSL